MKLWRWLLLCALLVVGGCGSTVDEQAAHATQGATVEDSASTGSTNEFCNAIAEGQQRVGQTLEERNAAYQSTEDLGDQLQNALEGMLEVESNLLAMYRTMAAAAPGEIQPQAQRLAELYEQQIDRSGSIETSIEGLVGATGEALLGGLRTAVELEQVNEYAIGACGISIIPTQGLLGPVPTPPSVESSPETAAEQPVPFIVTEPLIGFCESSTMEQRWYRVSDGTIAFSTQPVDMQAVPSRLDLNGQNGEWFPNEACGRTSSALSTEIAPRQLYDAQYTHVIAVAQSQDSPGVAVIDLATSSTAFVVEPAVESDFGAAPAEAQAAAFVPDTNPQEIIWREDIGGRCETYQAAWVPGAQISRSDLDSLRIGSGGACYGTVEENFEFVDGTPYYCRRLRRCQDMNGNDVDLPVATEPSFELPPSSRFRLSGAVVVPSGDGFFVGRDSDTRVSYAFVLRSGDAEPQQLDELGIGFWHPLGIRNT